MLWDSKSGIPLIITLPPPFQIMRGGCFRLSFGAGVIFLGLLGTVLLALVVPAGSLIRKDKEAI
jgi:hypothetical protein